MPVSEIRIAGFGGQGVILSAIIIGKAGCIYQPGYSTMTQNFGPEARGGACSAAADSFRHAGALSLRTASRHSGGDVAGSLRTVRSADQG